VQSTDLRLEHNAIYAGLFAHDPGHGKWHWDIYLHHEVNDDSQAAVSGHKLHATTNSGPWQYECVATDILGVPDLTVLAKIGAIEDDDWGVEFLDQYLSPIPMEIPEIDRLRERAFTCRYWFREAIRILHREQMSVDCPDVDALERELSSQARFVDAKWQRFSDESVSVMIVSKNARAVE